MEHVWRRGAWTIEIAIDGDVLRVVLLERGARIARFDSDPRSYDERFPIARSPVEVAPWLPLLAPGRTGAELARVFDATALPARTTLALLAELFGFSV